MASHKPIRYHSTRGGAKNLTFEQAMFEGLACDGGLLIPDVIPDVSSKLKEWSNLSFSELAFEIASLYVGEDEIPAKDLRDLVERSYSTFSHKDVVPTVELADFYVMELFHGPTFAFKDVALQALGNFFEYFLRRNGKRLTVVGATSGDTGGAAIYGMRGKENVDCFILFPKGRVSTIQQQQMTSVLDSNVHCVAVEGTFDDCQDIVKSLFGDLKFKKAFGLGAVNSINWARIMFQITYYFYTYYKLFPGCDGRLSFTVPTGNFGDILAGYYAKRMGLPVKQLVVATNSNDILHRFFTSGEYDKMPVLATSSPSMDIGVSSNFERYLYYLFGSDPEVLAQKMVAFKETGKLHASKEHLSKAQEDFVSARATEEQITETIQTYKERYGYVMCPHTACGVSALNQVRKNTFTYDTKHKSVVLATAHPGKFEDAVALAIGRQPLPPALEACRNAPTKLAELPNSAKAVENMIVSTARPRSACSAPCCYDFLRKIFGPRLTPATTPRTPATTPATTPCKDERSAESDTRLMGA